MRRPDGRTLLPLAGSTVLAVFAVATLPFSRGLFRSPRTPYDASPSAFVTVPAWLVLERAGTIIPRGTSVLVRTEPVDPGTDSYLHRFAVALLPGRQILPAALWGVPTDPAGLVSADYEVVVGQTPSSPPGRLLVELPEGSIWRRR